MQLKNFSEIDAIYSNRASFNAKFYKHIRLAEEAVALSYSCTVALEQSFTEEVKARGKKIDDYTAFRGILFRKCAQYSNAALLLATYGHVTATYSCIRSIFEHTLQLYYLQLCEPTDADFYFRAKVHKLNPPEEKILKSKDRYDYFSQSYLRKQLYSTKLNQVSEFYSGISKSTHPEIAGFIEDVEYNEKVAGELFKALVVFTSLQPLAFVEIYPNLSKEDAVILDNYFTSVNDLTGMLPDLLPDKSPYVEKLKAKDIETFLKQVQSS